VYWGILAVLGVGCARVMIPFSVLAEPVEALA
jgi:hypothetical protein